MEDSLSAIHLVHVDEAGVVATCARAAYAPFVERVGAEPALTRSDYGDLIARGMIYVIAGGGGNSV